MDSASGSLGAGGSPTNTEQAARERAAELQEALGIHVSAASDNDWAGAYAVVDFDGLDRLRDALSAARADLELLDHYRHARNDAVARAGVAGREVEALRAALEGIASRPFTAALDAREMRETARAVLRVDPAPPQPGDDTEAFEFYDKPENREPAPGSPRRKPSGPRS